jgi:hypothetical protein
MFGKAFEGRNLRVVCSVRGCPTVDALCAIDVTKGSATSRDYQTRKLSLPIVAAEVCFSEEVTANIRRAPSRIYKYVRDFSRNSYTPAVAGWKSTQIPGAARGHNSESCRVRLENASRNETE